MTFAVRSSDPHPYTRGFTTLSISKVGRGRGAHPRNRPPRPGHLPAYGLTFRRAANKGTPATSPRITSDSSPIRTDSPLPLHPSGTSGTTWVNKPSKSSTHRRKNCSVMYTARCLVRNGLVTIALQGKLWASKPLFSESMCRHRLRFVPDHSGFRATSVLFLTHDTWPHSDAGHHKISGTLWKG